MRQTNGGGGISLPTGDGRYLQPANPEVLTYAQAIVAAGSSISSQHLQAVDQFVTVGKRDGWWSAAKLCGFFGGTSLAGAALPLVGAALTLSNFVTADLKEGIGLDPGATNTTKYVDLGTDFAGLGLSATNWSAATFSPYHTPTGYTETNNTAQAFGATLANTPASGQSALNFGSFGGSGYPGGSLPCAVSGTVLATGDATSSRGYMVGVRSSVDAAASATPVGNLALFRNRQGDNSLYYTSLPLGLYWVGSSLTDLQARRLCVAIDRLMTALGRVPSRLRLLAYGDSNTGGNGSGNALNTRSSHVLARRLGMVEMNAGRGSSALLTANSASVPSGQTR